MRLILIFATGITQIFSLPQGYEFVRVCKICQDNSFILQGSPLSFEETHVDDASLNDSPVEVNNIDEIHADAVMEEQNIPSLSDGIWSSPIEVDDMSSLHADAVMEAKRRGKKNKIFESPVELDDMNSLHADAVMEAKRRGKKNNIFESPVELDDMNSLHADAVMEARKGKRKGGGKRIFETPVELDDLNNLHADAVMEAKKKESPGKKWFEAIDAKTLDKVITEMNEMNRWFAKVILICYLLPILQT